jgi:hypothetical protein
MSAPRTAHAPRRSASAHPLVGRAEAAAALSFLAAGIHLMVVDGHIQEWWAYGAFFLACAAGQAALAVLILRGTPPWLVLTGIAGNLAILGMYVLSRTNGTPLGPHAGRAEPAGMLDVTCAVAELGLVVALLGLLPERLARRTGTVLGVIGGGLWIARLSGLLL